MIFKKWKIFVLICGTYFNEKQTWYLTAEDWLKLGKMFIPNLPVPLLYIRFGISYVAFLHCILKTGNDIA